MSQDVTIVHSLPPSLAAAFNISAKELDEELSGGVRASFGTISIKGSKFRVSYKGEEKLVLNDEGEPKGYMDVILVRGSKALAKIFYKKKYEEGDDAAPDCFSLDGERPDTGSPDPQSELCATCPNYAWGSRVSESGNKGRACQDTRRIAVLPATDLDNEAYGGPLLLRVPAASLSALDKYSKTLKEAGFPYYAVVTRIGFDTDAAYPKLTFKPVGVVQDEDDGKKIVAWRNSDETSRMLTGSGDFSSPAATIAESAPAPKNNVTELPKKAKEPEPVKAVEPEAVSKDDEPGLPFEEPKTKKAEPPEVNEEVAEASPDLSAQLGKLLDGLS